MGVNNMLGHRKTNLSETGLPELLSGKLDNQNAK